jgi:LuxR family transcriptional regulator, quorum-sensing system regulator BjaR1
MSNRLLNFVDALQFATTLDESVAALLAELEGYGFTEAEYGFLPSGHPRFIDREILFAGGFWPEWEEAYLAENFIKNDYIVAHCLTSEQPIAFHDVAGSRHA